MSRRQRMSPIDLSWLRMERPTNLMMIVSVMMFEGPVDIPRLEKQLAERLTAHRRFRQRPEVLASAAYWRDDDNFDLAHHIHRVRLPGREGKAELQRFVAELAGTPLDFAHPLWQVHIIERYEGGVALVTRIHHAVGDGTALVAVMMSLADDAELPATSHLAAPEEEGWLQGLVDPLAAAVESGAKASSFTLKQVMEIVRRPTLAGEYLRTGLGVAAELAYLLVMPSDTPTRFKGKPRGSKRVAWSEPMRLDDVKAVAHAIGCSINDILLSCVAGAMRRYLVTKGDATDGVELRALAPINLRPPGSELEMGNAFGIIAVELPVGVEDRMKRLALIRSRMLELKSSLEPPVTLGLFAALGVTPKYVQDQFFDLLISRATAVMTNVPGPTQPIAIAGSTLKQDMFWVPQSGDIAVGVSILSYAGKVQFGLITDAAMVPDPEAVVAGFEPEFEGYLYQCLLDPPLAAAN